ncbi:MAG: PspC domain-containing protein [Anaerolineales bacterium]
MTENVKKLYRSRNEQMLAGVCGGLGTYFNIDPTLVRLLFVASVLLGMGATILIYFLMMIFVPIELMTEVVPA